MLQRRSAQSGFTLMELVLVMLIIAIIAGMLAPSLARFTAGRAVDNAGRDIVSTARLARAQAISEARTYRLNLDQSSGQYWVTADDGGGTFAAPRGELGVRHSLTDGIRMQVQITPQPNMRLNLPSTVQQQSVPQSTQSLNGETAAVSGSVMQNLHTQGTYVEFQPTGRTDPAKVVLTDTAGHSTQVACATPTDVFEVVSGAGAVR